MLLGQFLASAGKNEPPKIECKGVSIHPPTITPEGCIIFNSSVQPPLIDKEIYMSTNGYIIYLMLFFSL